MRTIASFEYVVPVFGKATTDSNGLLALEKDVVFGTSFHYAKGLFLTAGHVLQESIDAGGPFLGFYDHDKMAFIPKKPDWYEVIEPYDLGLMFVSSEANYFSFNCKLIDDTNELTTLTNVKTCGYPFAIDAHAGAMLLRLFAGYVVTCATHFDSTAKPRVYELSFAVPEGISGAPLVIHEIGRDMDVAGILLGSKVLPLDVISSEEVTKNDQSLISHNNHMQLGVALQLSQLKDLMVEKLGCTLSEYRTN